jgi:hypothetical protein
MKIQNIFIICLLCVGVFLVSGCVDVETTVDEAGVKETTVDTLTTTTYYFEDNGTEGQIVLNKIDNTATVDMEMLIDDDIEYPFTFEFGCAIWSLFFDRTALEEMRTEFKTKDSETETLPEDVEFKKVTIDFIDAEDKDKIATCRVTGEREEDIDLEYYRELKIPDLFADL